MQSRRQFSQNNAIKTSHLTK